MTRAGKEEEKESAFITEGNFACSLESIGEYNGEDPEDKELLRFTIFKKKEGGGFEEAENGSYCTMLTLPQNRRNIELAAKLILSQLMETLKKGESIKRRCEELSYADWKWVGSCQRTKLPIDPLTLGGLS